MKKKFPFYKQPDTKDCGPTCLRIVSKYYGKSISLQQIRNLSETTREGSSLLGLSDAAENLGFRSMGVQIDFNTLTEEVPFPCIAHWNKNHFVVVYKIDKNNKVYISDPSYGLITYTREEFIRSWIGENANENTEEGIVLILETTPAFFQTEFDAEESKASFTFLSKYLLKYKTLVIQLAIGLLGGSLLSLIFPFLTQSIVDVGIQNQDINFIYVVLLAQIMLFLGRMGIETIRSWILLHLSARINISIISDFFIKLMKLPISFFDTRMTGDIMQRINDHHRIEQLLTSSSLNTLFSLVNLIIFSIVLLFYDYRLFLVYLVGAVLYVGWISFFLKKRKELDYKRFSQVSQEQSKVIELINGMQEIKMHNAEKQKRWDWEFLQVKLFKIRIKSLSLEQWQSVGGNFINQMKDILVSFLSAKLVLSGNLTLGMMLSVQYIIGQLNSPLLQLIDFIKQTQDAKISLERLGEIHDKDDEEDKNEQYVMDIPKKDIEIKDMSFRYIGSDVPVFENLNLTIPYQQTTAIVGASGSGKTTLLKLLMKFYDPDQGEIRIGNTNMKNISPRYWRDHCGVVMQEGYVFNDTIANNIAVGEDHIDKQKLRRAVEIANIKEFIESLPLSYNTKIGNEGVGVSGGQKQRLFIARAVYKAPEYILFDEATSALDANNEKVIMENLEQFFKGKTAVVIAHRLSTVRHADKIIVLDQGRVVEEGSHAELVDLRGEYYRLVRNQLELGN
ncbi:Lactococcin-G-processing and transport ATP-binding protein LagD [Chryseobacterium gleum]|uniref:Lactococcin-G-processing and transport ATP-binding protein LagD n=2 Tax=Chryseobacterium gleum TaxID=250 RepID=A0A3S4M376_CHRGE|nr:peptidase domain-containing ABC transporter [Chryseobacterium gleum]EFK38069.1 ABC transporter, ATP-binding protein [Chryseobacterium gleum ATCC 35910]MCD9619320.1 peptidase domain-containing ABC transporter [Chryseobacterium gleum]MCE4067420.1 peptidase domain-containing ABC transporter [Chryseobacterium gleum]QQY32395.1 peptidase domain-containing ABC transporter [Chryseobacterium gleum]VEE10394.1 Lactococcin-G-processing and transport ATP-binding protein LagD [Chryseobacterium gleum]